MVMSRHWQWLCQDTGYGYVKTLARVMAGAFFYLNQLRLLTSESDLMNDNMDDYKNYLSLDSNCHSMSISQSFSLDFADAIWLK